MTDKQISLNTEALAVLLNAIEVAFRRGTFSVEEAGQISAAHKMTAEAVKAITEQQAQQTGRPDHAGRPAPPHDLPEPQPPKQQKQNKETDK